MRDEIEWCIKRCISPYFAFFQIFVKSDAGDERMIGFDPYITSTHLVRDEEFFKNYLSYGFIWNLQEAIRNFSLQYNCVRKSQDLLYRKIVPEPRVRRMKISPVLARARASSSFFGGFVPGVASSSHHSSQ